MPQWLLTDQPQSPINHTTTINNIFTLVNGRPNISDKIFFLTMEKFYPLWRILINIVLFQEPGWFFHRSSKKRRFLAKSALFVVFIRLLREKGSVILYLPLNAEKTRIYSK
jgi:hypothetical protein